LVIGTNSERGNYNQFEFSNHEREKLGLLAHREQFKPKWLQGVDHGRKRLGVPLGEHRAENRGTRDLKPCDEIA